MQKRNLIFLVSAFLGSLTFSSCSNAELKEDRNVSGSVLNEVKKPITLDDIDKDIRKVTKYISNLLCYECLVTYSLRENHQRENSYNIYQRHNLAFHELLKFHKIHRDYGVYIVKEGSFIEAERECLESFIRLNNEIVLYCEYIEGLKKK